LDEDGLAGAIGKAASYVMRRFGFSDPIEKRRMSLNLRLDRQFESTIAYGPFKGFKFSPDNWWSKRERGSMLLGIYEQELLSALSKISKRYDTFIDLGAADGYYGVGVLSSGMFRTSYCFEISEAGREVIRKNSTLNKVDDRITIYGMADNNFYNLIDLDTFENCVLFVDIEGGEFSLFDEGVFSKFRNSIIFIEMHEIFFENGEKLLIEFKNRASSYFSVSELRTTNRDVSTFSELQNWSDTDRWLICSEGREKLMTWLRLDPIRPAPKSIAKQRGR